VGLAFFKAQGQESVSRHTLVWKDDPVTLAASEQKSVLRPGFVGAAYPQRYDLLPTKHHRIKISAPGRVFVTLTDLVTEQLPGADLSLPANVLSKDFLLEALLTMDRKQPYAAINILPIRLDPNTGKSERLVSYTLNIFVTKDAAQNFVSRSHKTASNSVLANGSWHKISVNNDGVYKVDYEFMEKAGIDMESVLWSEVGLFGNGGGMLPEANSSFRYDDLQENAIFVHDAELDGMFGKDDYFLFYGQGPDRWTYDTGLARFTHIKHLYSNSTFYFITPDQGTNKRIQSQASSGLSATHLVTTFDDYKFNDFDRVNFLHSGRKWYGDEFGVITSKNLTFSFPNLVTSSPLWIKTAMASRSTNETTYFDVVAGSASYTQSFGVVGPDYTDPHGVENSNQTTFTSTVDDVLVNFKYRASFSSSQGWLDYTILNCRRSLAMSGDQMIFRDMSAVGAGNVANYTVTNVTSNTRIWDLTDHLNVKEQAFNLTGSVLDFRLSSDTLREFAVFDANVLEEPEYVEMVPNQDLHGLPVSDYRDMVILTHTNFAQAANTLADHHRTTDGLKVEVVDIAQVFNEFASGSPDVSAGRDYMKMLYDRAGMDSTKMPKYLLIFGDGSYDYKDRVGNNTNYIPAYESNVSLNPLTTFTSDDYYGFLDDSEGGNIAGGGNSLDIAVGRIPVKSLAEGNAVVEKIIHYTTPATFGPWRNMLTFVGDDEDGNTHINDSDDLTKYMASNYPEYNIDKIFLDAYIQEATPGGSRYPDVNKAITQRLHNGTFLMNYTGHGGTSGWAHERVFEIQEMISLENRNKLPLFVTATCTFTGFDDPDVVSPGEHLLLNPDGGAIALLSTVRLVFSHDNQILNEEMLKHLFQPINGEMARIGDIVRVAKNQIGGNAVNNRKFGYFGDPAITLAYPEHGIKATQINGVAIDTASLDTLSALAKVTISGEMIDDAGAKLTTFNGVVYPTIFDKARDIKTLVNDVKSKNKTFKLQKSIIYKGKASVINGDFSFTFIVPKDIAYNLDRGRISFYAENGLTDANGYSDDLIIGGTADSFSVDPEGPQLEIFMNDEKFVSGGMTDENPVLLIKLFDESGINTVGNGIGHDLTSVLDRDTKNTLVLNEFYEAALDDYQRGEVRYPFSELEDGEHSIEVKAWDVHNNSSKGFIEFIVVSEDDFKLSHVLNYPNPFTTNTNFQFEHNRPGEELTVTITIYSVSGKIVKSLHREFTSTGYRVDDMTWDGLDTYGDKIGKGVYVYNVTVRTSDGTVANKFEKLFILR
jgi:hypothetical protein